MAGREEPNRRRRETRDENAKQRKKDLRQHYLAARARLTKQEQTVLSMQICEHMEHWLSDQSQQGHPIRVVALYAAMGDEVDLSPLAERLRHSHIVTAYPKCYPQRRMSFYHVHSLEELTPSSFGVPEPTGEEAALVEDESIDAMLIPGLAYTDDGLRLGYGGGFYDTFLANPRVLCARIGAAYEIQTGAELPAEPFDRRVSYVVTERGVRPCISKDSY